MGLSSRPKCNGSCIHTHLSWICAGSKADGFIDRAGPKRDGYGRQTQVSLVLRQDLILLGLTSWPKAKRSWWLDLELIDSAAGFNSLWSEAEPISLNRVHVFYSPRSVWSTSSYAWVSSDPSDPITLQKWLSLPALPDHRSWVWLGS